jgi:hypothetical protein
MVENSLNEIQNQLLNDQSREVADMIFYLTQKNIFIKYNKNNQKNVLFVYFADNLQKLMLEKNKQNKKFVLLSDIYFCEAGMSKELLMSLYKEDIKSVYGLKLITKKRVIEFSGTHRSERDIFVKNVNLLISIMREWKSTNGLRNYFSKWLEPHNFALPAPVPHESSEAEFQIVKDVLYELIHQLELNSLSLTRKKLHNDLKLIEYETRYMRDQYNICKSQLKEKDNSLEGVLTTHTYVQHKLYLRTIVHRVERTQFLFTKWRLVLAFLDSKDLLVAKSVCRTLRTVAERLLSSRSSWLKLSLSGLRPRGLYWGLYFSTFHPLLRMRSLHMSAEVNEEIRKDVSRGLPDHMEEVEDALQRICSYNYEVGYCQGMQLVTHFLFTIYNNSDKVIETLQIIMEAPYFMGELWKNGFCRLKLAIFQLEVLGEMKLPFLMEHLRRMEISMDIIVTPWIVTIFTQLMYKEKLPLETLKQIWDLFIVQGWAVLISTSLAILYVSMDKVLGKGFEETVSAFSAGSPTLTLNTIKKFLVSEEFLRQLEDSFNLQTNN